MAQVFPNHSGIRSTVHKFQILDYVTWQRPKAKTDSSTLLPVLQTSHLKKSKMKTLPSIQPGLHSKPTMLMTSQPRNPREPHRRKLDPGNTQAQICLLKTLLRNRQASLQGLCNHQDVLIRLNQKLIKTIQDAEASSALQVRAMLQQQDVLGTIIDILEHSSKERLQQLNCELQEWEEKEESKLSYLQQQVEQLNAKIEKTQEEVRFLSTYMDHEYPVKSVQIANLLRQLQQIKDNQQDELDDLNEMRKMVLGSLSEQIHKKKKNFLRYLVKKTQYPHQEALLQKTRDSQEMLKCMDKLRDFIKLFQEEIPMLKAEVEQLQVQIQEPREVVFADVLLRRPKCSPDMDVVLSIPVEELLPF
ncbi:uncharacterized protein C20orf96 homolog isoform X2 [Manis javanica]|uniref:uncharacterized protein C20orf96 homolog isoform X2 n=1 Tax=Manis javanica TaxID=9974 RepID=UPI0008131B44|nr:uncharacterized protein C20orf96 homolog isoform X2 [Manis javanica]